MINKLKNLFRAVRKNRTVKQIETSGDPQVSEIMRHLERINNMPSIFEKKNNKIKCLENEIENQKLIIKEKERKLKECENLLEIAIGLVGLTTNKSMQNDN